MTSAQVGVTAPARLTVFLTVWIGQVISYIGSGLTSFALAVWAYEATGSVTQMTLISAFTVFPTLVLSPLAGAYVDRWDRRRAMIFSDTGAGLSTLSMALLLAVGHLGLWQIYCVVCASSIFSAFRWPALAASTTQLVPQKQFGRASGLLQIIQAGQALISPILAGILMARIHLQGIVLIDVITYAFALGTLTWVTIPTPGQTVEGQVDKGSILREMVYGWTYIRKRPGVLAMLTYGFSVNLLIDMAALLLVPLVLGRASSAALGTTLSIGGIGFLVGGAIMSAWGGPTRAIYGLVGFPLLAGVFMALIGLQSTLLAITVCLFGVLTCLPLFFACSQTILQRITAPDIQGRVFAIRRMVIMSSRLVASLAVGPLADHLVTPLLGRTRGVGVLFNMLGMLMISMSVAALVYTPLRTIDNERSDTVDEPAPQRAHAY